MTTSFVILLISILLSYREIPYWMLAGIGYQVGQFFMVKYVAMFGIPANFAKFDQLKPPYTPRCGGWIYKYSDMWRYAIQK